MPDKDYIFNIPKAHVEVLAADAYASDKDVWNITVQEIGEFLQAYSKYSLRKGFLRKGSANLAELRTQREHFVEEMTHVLVCFGIIAHQERVAQKEIDAQIKKKAIDGVKYPFDVNEHAPIDQVIKDLKNCSFERTAGQLNPTYSCLNCKTGEFSDPTMTCRALLNDALYYIQQAYEKTEGPDQK